MPGYFRPTTEVTISVVEDGRIVTFHSTMATASMSGWGKGLVFSIEADDWERSDSGPRTPAGD